MGLSFELFVKTNFNHGAGTVSATSLPRAKGALRRVIYSSTDAYNNGTFLSLFMFYFRSVVGFVCHWEQLVATT